MIHLKSPSYVRLRMIGGILRIHDLKRNFIHEVYPFEWEKLDSDGISSLIKKFIPFLTEKDVFKLAKKLKELDISQVN